MPPASSAASEFGHRVRVRRVDRRMSREQLAEASGLHAVYIGDVERGNRNPTLRSILLLARALEVKPGDLLGGLEDLDVDTEGT